MKFTFIAVLSFLFLTGCALYSGLNDQSTPTTQPTDQNARTIKTPTPAPTIPSNSTQNEAATEAGKIISPIVN